MKHQLKEKTISIREVHRNLSDITRDVLFGRPFIVTKNGQPVFRIEPIEQAKPKNLREDFKHIQFSSGDPDLSQKVDEIVYGI